MWLQRCFWQDFLFVFWLRQQCKNMISLLFSKDPPFPLPCKICHVNSLFQVSFGLQKDRFWESVLSEASDLALARGAASGCGESRNGRLVGSTQQATPAWAVAKRATLGWATHCHMRLGHFWEGHMLRGLSGSYSENICSTIVEEF